MTKKIAIVDYGLGNLYSITQAVESFSVNVQVTSQKRDILDSDALILPGVGAFGHAMTNLKELDLIDPLKQYIRSGKPVLGICLGMQLLFSESEEYGIHEGLNVIPGRVTRFVSPNEHPIRVPHIGWSAVRPLTELAWRHSPLRSIEPNESVYFVHSFRAEPADECYVSSVSEYANIAFCSSVIRDNLFATQFHPEKSGKLGLKIIETWLDFDLQN